MSRHIDAEKLWEEIESEDIYTDFQSACIFKMVREKINNAPTADVEKVRHGKWVTVTVPRHDPHGEKFWLCTNCERAWHKELLVDVAFGDFPKRCPECGAHMSTEKEEK